MFQNYKAQNKFSKKDKNVNAVGDNFSREDYSESVTRYYEDLSKIPTLTAKEERDIVANHSKDDVLDEYARTRLVEGNLKFVFKVASAYKGSGVSLPELISLGNEGLVIAIDKFQPSKGFRFYCYAIHWIKAKISGYIKKQKKVDDRLSNEYDTNSGDDDDELDDPFLKSSEDLWSDVETETKPFDVDFMSDDDSMENCSQYSDEYGEDDTCIEDKEKNQEFSRMLQILTSQEFQIVKMNYGLGEKKKSVREISTSLNITQSKVKSVKNSAISKLKVYAKTRPDVMELFV